MKYFIVIGLILMMGCKTSDKSNKTRNQSVMAFTPIFTPGPMAMVYKTRADYNNLVPVLLNDDKTEIISYPHQVDIIVENGYPKPLTLADGYLLDNRGINQNVAFLKLTYEEYAALDSVPNIAELYDLIIDKDPLTEMCNCGNKSAFTNVEEQINQLIKSKSLKTTCKTVK